MVYGGVQSIIISMKKYLILAVLFCVESSWAQNLMRERIRKIEPRKRSIFLNGGIFHGGERKGTFVHKAVRHSYDSAMSQERVVFDFGTEQPPSFYGYIDSENKKMYVGFFDTGIEGQPGSFGNSRYVEGISFFPITEDLLSVEIQFKESVSADIFTFVHPGDSLSMLKFRDTPLFVFEEMLLWIR